MKDKTATPSITQEPLTEHLKARLLNEIVGSRFAHTQLPAYLASCDTVIRRVPLDLLQRQLPEWTVVVPASEATDIFLMHLERVAARCDHVFEKLGIKKNLRFWIIPAPQKKEWPTAGVPVRPENINGGFTYLGGRQADIYLLRKEEWPKVALHEMLHHSKLNIPDSEWARVGNLEEWYHQFRISMKGCQIGSAAAVGMEGCATDLRPNEAVIETWADILQCRALSRELGVEHEELMKAEADHAMEQAARVLVHQRSLPGGEWTEKSHSWSYLLLRAAMMWDLKGFMRLTQGSEYSARSMARWSLTALQDSAFLEELGRRQQVGPRTHARSMCMTLFGHL